MSTLVINYLGREKRYALIKDKQVEKLVIEQPKQASSVGSIYLGTVTKVLPGMNAAFIDIDQEKNGYLHRDKIPSFLQAKGDNKSISSYIHQGEKLLVQVEKDPTGNKGPRLTGVIEFNGHAIVYMPKGGYVAVSKKIKDPDIKETWRRFGYQIKTEEEGLLFRTSCEHFTEGNVLEELEQLRKKYEKIVQISKKMKKPGLLMERNSFLEEVEAEIEKMAGGIVAVDVLDIKQQLVNINQKNQLQFVYHNGKENIFSAYGLNHDMEKVLKRIVWLENGAYLIFDEAEALTIVDVNTGKFSGKNNLRETVVKTNEWAAAEIARQIRLRDIGGMILVDFIDMKNEEDRERVIRKMELALKKDERMTRIVGFTPLGILQLTRKRTRVSISEALTTKCQVCEGTGMVLSPETIAFGLERELWEHRSGDYEAVLIETTKEVKDVFTGEQNIHQLRLEELLGLRIFFSVVNADKPFYIIKQLGDIKDIERK